MTKHAKLMLEIFAAIERGDTYERDVLNDPQEIWSQDMQEVLDALDAFADEQQPDRAPLGAWQIEPEGSDNTMSGQWREHGYY